MATPNSKSYGVPLYGASWLPLNLTPSQTNSSQDDSDKSPSPIDAGAHVVLSGGGGEGHGGIPNALLVSQFDFTSNSLSDQPDGKLRVFKWPSMDTILDESNAHTSVKDLAFSPDGKFLSSVGSDGPSRVWNVALAMPIASLQKEKDERFGFCRFSPNNDKHQVLYVTAMQGKGGSIVKWNTTSWTRINSKHIVRDSITAFNVSANGKRLAVGTIEGDILILNSVSMRVQTVVKKAHLGIVTVLKFSHDSRALLSASFDSCARVTLMNDEKQSGWSLWVILFIILPGLGVALYYAESK